MKIKEISLVEKSKDKKRSFNAEKLPLAVNPIDNKKSIRQWCRFLSILGILIVLLLLPLWIFMPASSRYLVRNNSAVLEVAPWNSRQTRQAILRQAKIYLSCHPSPAFEKIVLNGLRNLSLNFTKSEIKPFLAHAHFPELWQSLIMNNSHSKSRSRTVLMSFASKDLKDLSKDFIAEDLSKDIIANASLKAKTFRKNEDLFFTGQVLEELAQTGNENDARELLEAKEFLALFDNNPSPSSNSSEEFCSDKCFDGRSDGGSSSLQFSDDCWFEINCSLKQRESFYQNPLDRIAFYTPDEILTVDCGSIFQIKTVSPWGILMAFLLLVFSVPGTLPLDNWICWLIALEQKIGRLGTLKLSENYNFYFLRSSFQRSGSPSSLIWADIRRLLI